MWLIQKASIQEKLEIITLGFYITLVEMKKNERNSSTNCAGKHNKCESSIWKYLSVIFECEYTACNWKSCTFHK